MKCEKSVYIHIPFCNTICSYCDFPKFYYQKNWVEQYLSKLEQEIDKYYQKEPVTTLYIGGGTPSCLNIEELKKLFQIIQKLNLNHCFEFTFECNIESLTKEKMRFLKNNGVNRFSIGVETFQEKYLTFLNRNHTRKEVKEKIKYLKKIGIQNINVDFIYALKDQSLQDVKEDLEELLNLDIPHISTYSLMIEPHTKLFLNKIVPIEEDLDFEMYQTIEKTLLKHQYIHYEISNYAKPGFFSNHNLVYWNNQEYYGFGLGASGYIEEMRYDNTRNWTEYQNGKFRKNVHKIEQSEKIENELILGFRKIDGISKKQFYQKYNKDLETIPIIQKLLKEGKLEKKDENIKIPKQYIYISNQILYQLIGEVYE